MITMKQHIFEIELKQPIIISQQATTVGAHQSLDYISGSTLLGLAASKLYSQVTAEDAFLLFHSGYVRFLDALPVHNHEIAYPVPLSLHAYKGEKYQKDNSTQLDPERMFDAALVDREKNKEKQLVQLRNFYLTESGHKVTPSKEQTLKTAIDAKQNRAAESQLFGYEALSKGQVFRFLLQADDQLSEDLWKKLIASLEGVAHLGRSRSAQFGRVSIQSVAKAHDVQKSQIQSQDLTLWLISDVYLQKDGQNSLIPDPETIGLPLQTKFKVEQSFIRSRRYSIYNAYRKHYDKERQVLSRGSVLRYELPADFKDFERLSKNLAQGIGLYTESGLGQVLINPQCLEQAKIVWAKSTTQLQVNQKVTMTEPRTTLIETLKARQHLVEGVQPRLLAESLFIALCEKIMFARRYHAIAKGTAFETGKVPSRTQFGRFKAFANQYRNDPEGLWRELTNTTNGMLHITGEEEETKRQSGKSYHRGGWELKFGLKDKETLGDFLKAELQRYYQSADKKAHFPQIVAELAVFGLSDQWEKYCLGSAQSLGAA